MPFSEGNSEGNRGEKASDAVEPFRMSSGALLTSSTRMRYVRDQLGHASIQLRVDTYGHLVPGANG